MHRVLRLVAVFLAAVFLAVAPPRAGAQSVPSLEDFVGRNDFWGLEMSPNGAYVAALHHKDGADYILLVSLDPGGPAPQHIGVGDYDVEWLEWANDDTLLVATTGWVDLKTGRQLSHHDFEAETSFFKRSEPYRFSRLISINRETQKMAVMFGDDWRMNRNFYLGNVVDFLPSQPDHILMPARLDGDLDLFKVNVTDGTFTRIATGTSSTAGWHTDRTGEPAFRLDLNRRGTVATIYARENRENGQIKWRKTRTIRIDQEERDASAKEFEVLYPGPTNTTYYVLARPEGEDRTSIYLYDFEQDKLQEKVSGHDRVDISGGLYNWDTRSLLGAVYVDDRLVIEMQDGETQAHLAGLSDFFGDQTSILPIDSSRDGKRWLLKTEGPTDSGSYHVYSLDTASNSALATQKSSMAGKLLGPSKRIDYTARDGTKLHGYLTRAANAAPDAPLPLIMMPHGGPESRSSISFNWNVQFLVSLGYQVFEPNFRGSSGYGKAFADQGRRQWGKIMQTDVDDALAHLITSGLVREGESCIVGYSYGGYAALAAAVQTPEAYACIVAGAGVSDLLKMLSWERAEEGRDSESYLYWVSHIGSPSKDKDELEAYSPARNAEKVKRPVLLIHGESDGIVPIEQSELMEKALRKAGKNVEFLRLPNSGHSYRPAEDERAEFEAVRRFLAAHLPVAAP